MGRELEDVAGDGEGLRWEGGFWLRPAEGAGDARRVQGEAGAGEGTREAALKVGQGVVACRGPFQRTAVQPRAVHVVDWVGLLQCLSTGRWKAV